MREALRQLAAAATMPTVAGRVFDTNGALPEEPTPFVVMVVGAETVEVEWVAPMWTVTFWATADRFNPFTTLDSIIGQLVTGLDQKKIVDGAESFLVKYAGSSAQDDVDEDRDLISRSVRFTVEAEVYVPAATFSPDPVLAVQARVAAAFPTLTLSEDLEPTTDPAPAVYFRVGLEDRLEPMVGGLGAWHTVTLYGHVSAPGFQAVHRWARRLAEFLARQTEITLDDDSPMWVQGVTLDVSANARTQGQIRATLRFGTLAAADVPVVTPGTPIEHVYGRDPEGALLPAATAELVTPA